MTTELGSEFKVDVSLNLFEKNSCLNLRLPQGVEAATPLACVAVSRSVERQTRDDLIWSCVRYALESFLHDIGDWTCWLFACVCGENGRVTRHKGLWKLLAQQGVLLSDRVSQEMHVVRDGEVLCIYGAMGVEGEGVSTVRQIVSPSSRSFLALLPRAQSPALDLVIAAKWQRGLSSLDELRDIALAISQQGGVLLRLFGEFDDRDVGVDCIMMESLCRAAVAVMP